MEVVKNGLKGTSSICYLRKVYPSTHDTSADSPGKESRLSCFGEITQRAWMRKGD
jgi:hypothetical protein